MKEETERIKALHYIDRDIKELNNKLSDLKKRRDIINNQVDITASDLIRAFEAENKDILVVKIGKHKNVFYDKCLRSDNSVVYTIMTVYINNRYFASKEALKRLYQYISNTDSKGCRSIDIIQKTSYLSGGVVYEEEIRQ